jgi:leucyl-tRNA synthetase
MTNKFLKEITNNIENFSYNKIIANLHETYSALNKIILNKIEKKKLIENYKKILIAINPIIPHFSNECMEMIQINEEILWPKVDEKFLFEDNIKFIIQFNGKTRKIIETNKDINEEYLINEIKKDKKMKEYLSEKRIQKKIFIPNKLMKLIIN